jgi:hypothetical protein
MAIASLAASSPAGASPSARLVYARAPEASSCPDETALRSAVAARLGYDPFFPWARQTVVVQVWRESGKYRARLQLVDAQGLAHGTRALASSQATCAELFDTAALAISIAMDSLPRNEPEPEAPPVPATGGNAQPSGPPPAPPAPLPPEPAAPAPPPPEPRARLAGFAGAEVLAAFDAEPEIAAGLAAFGGVVGPSASIALELRADAPASTSSAEGAGSVRAWSYGLSLVPCGRVGALSLCALGTASLVYARGEGITVPQSDHGVAAAAGARVGLEWPLSSVFALRTHLDGLVALRRVHLQIDGEDAWTAPVASVALAAGIAARFE